MEAEVVGEVITEIKQYQLLCEFKIYTPKSNNYHTFRWRVYIERNVSCYCCISWVPPGLTIESTRVLPTVDRNTSVKKLNTPPNDLAWKNLNQDIKKHLNINTAEGTTWWEMVCEPFLQSLTGFSHHTTHFVDCGCEWAETDFFRISNKLESWFFPLFKYNHVFVSVNQQIKRP